MTRFQDRYNRPSREQIEKASYARWEDRGHAHGWDARDWFAAELDLTFDLNYHTVTRHEIASTTKSLQDTPRHLRCRFCEQSAPNVRFTPDHSPIPAFMGGAAIASRDICEECAQSFRANLEPGLGLLWESLPGLVDGTPEGTRIRVPLVAFKGLSWIALALMPEAELEHFPDALEWVSNPDHDEDWSLITGLSCLVYSASTPYRPAWIGLERRNDGDAPLPSILLFLASGDFCLQFPVPLGVLDQELDGEDLKLLRRSSPLKESLNVDDCRLLIPAPAAVPARRGGRRLS